MDERTKITLGILSSVSTGHQTYSSIKAHTNFSPTTLKNYLPKLEQRGLIKTDSKDWRRGKSKHCFITEAGTKWLINTSIFDSLKAFSTILAELKKPENRNIYQKARHERYSQTHALVLAHFRECAQKGVHPFRALDSLSEWEYNKRFKITDMDGLLREALRKLFAVMMYLWSDSEDFETIENKINECYVIFAPGMLPWYLHLPNSRPALDFQFQEIEREYWAEERRRRGEPF